MLKCKSMYMPHYYNHHFLFRNRLFTIMYASLHQFHKIRSVNKQDILFNYKAKDYKNYITPYNLYINILTMISILTFSGNIDKALPKSIGF